MNEKPSIDVIQITIFTLWSNGVAEKQYKKKTMQWFVSVQTFFLGQQGGQLENPLVVSLKVDGSRKNG